MGFHDLIIATDPGSRNSQSFQLGIHEDPGRRTHPAVQHGNILPSQIGPALDLFGIALLHIEALGAIADVHQHRRNTGHQAADEGGVVIKAVEQMAGRNVNLVLVQGQQALEAVEIGPGGVDTLDL